jgi:WD40 repeat protein
MRNIKDFNPFPGLRPFTPEDSDFFCGREGESEDVILRLLKNSYISIIGGSGNGKSSLVYGGIVPKIMKLKVGDSSVWKLISLRPGNDPFGNLAIGISSGIEGLTGKQEAIIPDLRNNSGSFSDILGKYFVSHDVNILLVIDQFEELFRYSLPGFPGKSDSSHNTVIKFVDSLVSSVTNPVMNVFIIITMRFEYLDECSHYKGLTRMINTSNYFVPDIAAENWREIIEGPFKIAGVKIEPALVVTLLDVIKNRPGRLPVLQHALMRTWNHWLELNEPDRPVGKASYDSIGTMSKAISLHADEVYNQLSQRGKEICEVMFKTITRKSSDNKGLRHPSYFGTIKSIADCSFEELTDIIEKFREPSRSFITAGETSTLNETSIIDLQNENLIYFWDRLKEWVDDEASSMRMYARLSESSALYQQGKTGLFRPPDLQTVINWRNQQKPALSWAVQYNTAFERAMVYLRTSEKAYIEEEQNKVSVQNRTTKRIRLIARILGIVALAAVGIMYFAQVKRLSAEKLAVLAQEQISKAITDKTRADSSASIAIELKIISDSVATVALKDAEVARQEKIVAEIQKSYAEKNADAALSQKNLAIEERNGTQQLRILSVGKSMSLKSLQLEGQKDLQALLAYQAYLFNKRNNGPENDADIYAGLYNVALHYGSIDYRTYKGQNGEIRSVAFVPGKNEFFTSGDDGRILKWSLDKKDQTLQVIYSGPDIMDVLAVSPDASWLACGSSSSSIRMIPLKGNTIGYELNGHKGAIKSLIYSYDGKYLYSAALDGKVMKWDIAARTSKNVNTGSMEISSIDISSKGNYLAGISTDGNVVVWDPDNNSDNFRIETAGKNVKVVRFSPDNNLLAIGDLNGNVELWDINLRRKISEVKAHDSQISDIRFNITMKQMATSGYDRKLKIFNIKDPADLTEPPVTVANNEGLVLVMQFSPDGQMIISGETGGSNNLMGRPTHADYLVRDVCNIMSRNMSQEEWNLYVGKDIPLEKTCPDKSFNIKVEPIISNSK